MDNKVVTELLQALIRIPSENNGVTGYENDVQQFFYSWLKDHDLMRSSPILRIFPVLKNSPVASWNAICATAPLLPPV